MDNLRNESPASDGRVVAEVEEDTVVVPRSSDHTEVWAEMRRIIAEGGRKAVVDVRRRGPAFEGGGVS
jgi:hypothetical protein